MKPENEEHTLLIDRSFDSPRTKVFKAWTSAEALSKWFAPSDKMTTEVLELNIQVGGRYTFKMINENNEEYIVGGEYISIIPNEQLIFTWKWQSHEDSAEMLITLEFIDEGNSTVMKLLQERIPSEESRKEHNKGWQGCLARLDTCLQN